MNEWLQLKYLEGPRGRGALDLRSQPCDETQREVMNEMATAFNMNKSKS